MCGIAGVWGGVDPAGVGEMVRLLQHRGPDAQGMHVDDTDAVTLGHSRLSIIDLDHGDQPLYSRSGGVLVANTEIYNAASLRELLGKHMFSTRSDSEVVLHLLADGGIPATSKLRGMYAFAAVIDGELLLGRDPMGIKPLYRGELGGNTVFASELKAFPVGATGVEPIRPGTVWSSRSGEHSFFRLQEPASLGGDMAWHAERVRRALERSVRIRLTSDVPVGAFLSGGLDSSAVVALMRQHVDELHTFSVGLPGSPDLAAARVVADHLGTVHHEHVIDPDEVLEALPSIVHALESYDQDLVRSAVPTYFTARLAARHVKVVLTGEGADELFAGYSYHKDIGDLGSLDADIRRSLGELHHINLQRVDRLTMAHSLEARVPFLDIDFVATAMSVPVALRRPGLAAGEKAVLRHAVSDLLPREIVWRDKAQFDEGSGTAELLPALMASAASHIDPDSYMRRHPGTPLRSAEECRYHELLVSGFADPVPVLANVARWAERDEPGLELTAAT